MSAVGRVLARTDQAGKTTTYTYDEAGRLQAVANPLGHTTTYTYDTAGNLLSIADANGHQTSLAYDDLNRLAQKTWPDGSFETFGYDPVGNQTSHQLADGNTNAFVYDELNRMAHISYFDEQSVDFTYTPDGRRETVTDSRGVTSYEYDYQGRVTRIIQPSGENIAYTYDAAGNRLSMTTQMGSVTYSYDAANQLASVANPSGQTTTYAYDPVGLCTQRSLPNGVTENYTYDALDRLTDIVQQNGATTLASYSYTLGAAGNRLSVTEADGSSIHWAYDDAYRLLSETRRDSSDAVTYQAAYTYDPVGNRLSQTVDGVTVGFTYNALDQVVTAGAAQYSYDARGNLTQVTSGADVTHYTYDAADRLTAAALPDGSSAGYAYDADGRRVRQTIGAQVTNYLWDEASPYGDVVLETDGGGSPTAGYVLGGTELISQDRGGATSYYLLDGQSSVRALTDSTGSITDQYAYDAFGTLQSRQGATVNPYQYTGQQFDDLTGLYSLRARYYNPADGRFLTRDLAAVVYSNPVEINRYVYAANDPINRFDPTGYFAGWAINTNEREKDTIAAGNQYRNAFLKPPEPYQFSMDVTKLPMAVPKVTWWANPYVGPFTVGPYIIGPYFVPLTIGDFLAVLLWRLLLDPRVVDRPIPIDWPEPGDGPLPVPTPEPTPPPPAPKECVEGDPDCDDEQCDPEAFILWWFGLPEVRASYKPNNDDYRYEQMVARGNGAYGIYSRTVQAGSETIDADGIDPDRCCLVDAKNASGDTQFRLDNPPPWAIPKTRGEFRRYRLAIYTPVENPRAQPRALIVRTNTDTAEEFFLSLLQLESFVVGIDGFVEQRDFVP